VEILVGGTQQVRAGLTRQALLVVQIAELRQRRDVILR
jgi:hypothetical protein